MVDSHEGTELSESPVDSFLDAHCHLDDPSLDVDREAILADARRAGVRAFVIGGYSPATFDRARALRSPSVRVGVGIHPWAVEATDDVTLDEWVETLPELLRDADALGEIGLDRLRARKNDRGLERQVHRMRQTLAVGRTADRPIVLHVVHAHPEAQALVREAGTMPPVVVHGFVGNAEIARAWLSLGAYLSFGPDTLRSDRTLEAARVVPLDRLLLESDAPHGPQASRSIGPPIVATIAGAIGSRLGVPVAGIAAATWSNAERLFFRDRADA